MLTPSFLVLFQLETWMQPLEFQMLAKSFLLLLFLEQIPLLLEATMLPLEVKLLARRKRTRGSLHVRCGRVYWSSSRT